MSAADDRANHWAKLPKDTDLLITHGPPLGILDRVNASVPQGDLKLLHSVERVQPLIHAFGHVHGAYGMTTVGETTFVNAVLLGLSGDLQHLPIHLRLRRSASSK